jgi:hypothetical protein
MIQMTRKRPVPVCEDLKERMIRRILAYNKHLSRIDFINKTIEVLMCWIPELDRAFFKDELLKSKRQTV